MNQQIKTEAKVCLQYFAIALVAGVIAFVVGLPREGSPGQIAVAVNIREAWLNYQPVLLSWLLGFALLSIIRLLITYLTRARQQNS